MARQRSHSIEFKRQVASEPRFWTILDSIYARAVTILNSIYARARRRPCVTMFGFRGKDAERAASQLRRSG
jgi:hypothetical protein